jgi:phosphatidylglycerophosphate synthase
MASCFRLRTIFAPIVQLIARGCIYLHISPNQATWIMAGVAILSALILTWGESLLGFGICLFITGLFDGVDGAIARITNQKSKFGAFFDSTMDRVSEVFIFGALFWNQSWVFVFSSTWNILLCFIAFISSQLISYTRARVELALNRNVQTPDSNIGLMGRSERLFFLFILSIIVQFFPNNLFTYGFTLFTVLVFATFIFRFFEYKVILKK